MSAKNYHVPVNCGFWMAQALKVTPAVEAELEWLAGEGPPNVARHARIVLGRARGLSIAAVAVEVGVHPNTVRNCLRRFIEGGLRGLAHASAGKPKSAAFTDAVRDEISRLAMHSPANAGERYGSWSLRRLREHLLRRGVVRAISVEGLRQQLRGLPLPPPYWRRDARPRRSLNPDVRRALESLADGARADRRQRAQIVLASIRGLNESEIAAALHLGRGTVRRWLRRFRRAGILGLQSQPRRALSNPQVCEAVVRMASGDPRMFGVNAPVWTLENLQTALIRQRVLRSVQIESLRRLLGREGIDLSRDHETAPYAQRSPAVG